MSVRTSLAWTFSEQSLQYGLQFAASVIIARLLTPDELGIFALAMSAAALLTSLRTFGVGNYLIREPDLNPEKIRSAFGVMLVMSWSLGLLLFLARNHLAAFYDRAGIAEVMALLALSFLIAPFGTPVTSLLTREMRFRALHNIGLLSNVAGSLLSVSLAFAGYSYMALAWGILLTTALSALLPMLVLPRYAFIRPSLVYWRDITRFGGLLSLSEVISMANTQGMRFILGAFTSPALVAQFIRASQVPNLYRHGIFTPVARVLMPAWSRSLRDGRSIAAGIEKLVALNTVLVWPVFLALALIAVPFITLVFGENWRPAGEIFAWILLAQAILVILPQPQQVLVPHGRVARLLVLRSATAAFSLATAVYGAALGLEAFAMLRVLVACFIVTANYVAIRGLVSFQSRRFGVIYLRSAFVAVFASVPAAAYRFGGPGVMDLVDLLTVIAGCALFWLAGAAATRHVVWLEGLAALRRVRAARRLSP